MTIGFEKSMTVNIKKLCRLLESLNENELPFTHESYHTVRQINT